MLIGALEAGGTKMVCALGKEDVYKRQYMESLPKICGTEVDSRKQGEWTVAYCIAYIKNTGYPFAGLTGAFASGASCSPFCSCAVSASGDVERR